MEENCSDMRGKNAPTLLASWLELRDLIETHPELKKVLFDPVTGLPTTPLLFPRISSLLEERGEVSLLCVNISRYSHIESIYGWQAFDDVMRQVAEALDAIAGFSLRDSDVIAELMVAGNSFVVVLSPPRMSDKIDPESREALALRVEADVRERLAQTMEPALFKKFGCYVGSATVQYDDEQRLERLVYDALDRALTDSCQREEAEQEGRIGRLRDVIDGGHIRTMVHPLVRLDDLSIIGYEALSRGPEGSEFERPEKLFKTAYDADQVLRLERACRKAALDAATKLPEGRLLFMNVEPDAVADPELREALSTQLISDAFDPKRIVLEVTERCAISDFPAFRATLEYLRRLGFTVAVDDAGAGYGSLECLAELRPEWLKVDMSLVRGCDTDDVRRHLIEALVMFSHKVGSSLIAEGIETEGEFETLKGIGVEFGQGFYFAQPHEPFPGDECVICSDAARVVEGSTAE